MMHAEMKSGAGGGEPVVFIHGALSDYCIWSLQCEALSEQYHTVAYSRRYHSPNKWTDDGGNESRSLHVTWVILHVVCRPNNESRSRLSPRSMRRM